jgi:hypothetical protein
MIILRIGLLEGRVWDNRRNIPLISFSSARLMSADRTNLPRVVSTSTGGKYSCTRFRSTSKYYS